MEHGKCTISGEEKAIERNRELESNIRKSETN